MIRNKYFQWFIYLFPVLVLLGLSLWTGKGLFTYKFWSTHDGNHHLARSFDAVATIAEGHFPLRWAGSLNYGCGVPVFNYFYPLFYYLIAVINSLSGNIYLAHQLINLLSLIVGTVFYYYWMRLETDDEAASFLGGLLYLFAPYRFSLIFVRGSPEYLAYAIFPIVLACYSLIINSRKGSKKTIHAFFASVTGALLIISHNFTVMFLMPLILIFLITKLFVQKSTHQDKLLSGLSFLGSILMSAFFWGPVILEKTFVKLGSIKTIDFKDHFPTFGQLLRSKWGYFYSGPGVESDGMSFMLGYAQWLLLAVVFIWLMWSVWKRRKDFVSFILTRVEVVTYFILSLLFIFLMLSISTPVWNMIPFLQEIQFPWRLLGMVVLTLSVLSVYFTHGIKNQKIKIVLIALIGFLAIFGNRHHLLPMPIADEDFAKFEDFSRLHEHRYSTTTFGDDILSKDSVSACNLQTPTLKSTDWGKINYQIIAKGSTYGMVQYFWTIKDDINDNKIIVALEYFPKAFQIELNGNSLEYENCEGRVCFSSTKGREGVNYLTWKVVQTPIEQIFNYLSLFALITAVGSLSIRIINVKIKFSREKLMKILPLSLNIVVFCFFRFYQLPNRMGFAWDLERDAYEVAKILSGNLTLIGPRVVGPEGFHLPPYFYYVLTPFYTLTEGNPQALIIFIWFFTLLFFGVSYWVLKKIFFKWFPLIFLMIWAVHPLMIGFDTTPWNPILLPLMFMLLIYCLYLFYKLKKDRYLWVSAIIFGLGVSFHFQFVFYGLMFIPFIWKRQYIKTGVRRLISIVMLSLIPFIPLLVFDLRHNFNNLSTFWAMAHRSALAGPNHWLRVLTNFISSLFLLPVNQKTAFAIYGLIIVITFVLLKKLETRKYQQLLLKGLLLVLFFSPILLTFYQGELSEYYLLYLISPISLTLLLFINWVFEKSRMLKIISGLFFLILILVMVRINFNYFKRIDQKGYQPKKEVVEFLSLITKNREDFNISFTVPLGEDSGFRYLIDYYGIKYSGMDNDTLIQITYPADDTVDNFIVGVYGIRVPESWLELSFENQ